MSTSRKIYDNGLRMWSTISDFQDHLNRKYRNSNLAAYGQYMRAMRFKYDAMSEDKRREAFGDTFALFQWTDDDWLLVRYREEGRAGNQSLYQGDLAFLDEASELLEGTEKFLSATRQTLQDYDLYVVAKGVCRHRRNRDAYLDELRAWLKAKENGGAIPAWRGQGDAEVPPEVQEDAETSSDTEYSEFVEERQPFEETYRSTASCTSEEQGQRLREEEQTGDDKSFTSDGDGPSRDGPSWATRIFDRATAFGNLERLKSEPGAFKRFFK